MALRRREALALAGVALAAAGTGFVLGPHLLNRQSVDTRAISAARFKDLDGATRDLSKWHGKVLVLNFWATWCAPCREEIPMLMVARDKYAPLGVEIVGIAIDIASKVAEYVKQMQIAYPVLVADAGGLELMRALGNTAGGLPYTVIVDARGNPAKRKLGALKQDEIEFLLADVVRKPLGGSA